MHCNQKVFSRAKLNIIFPFVQYLLERLTKMYLTSLKEIIGTFFAFITNSTNLSLAEAGPGSDCCYQPSVDS